LTATSLIFDLL